MRVVKTRMLMAVVMVALLVGGVLTQAMPTRQNPPVQTPPAGQQPPAAPNPQAQTPQAPAPFPEGAKVAYVFMQGVFNGSAEGKAAAAKLQEWEKKKTAEIQAKMKEAEAVQGKLNEGSTLLNDAARSQAQRDLQRLQREIQGMQEDAQLEGQDLRRRLLAEFTGKVNPTIADVAKERGLHMVFSVSDGANIAWADPGLDLTREIITRVDAASSAGQKK